MTFLYASVVVGLLGGFVSALSTYSTMQSASDITGLQSLTSDLYLALIVTGVAAVLAVVGTVGLLLGIWRLGTRYRSMMFRASVIAYLVLAIATLGISAGAFISYSPGLDYVPWLLAAVSFGSLVPPALLAVASSLARGRLAGRVVSAA
jgi:hypothetical protein